MTSGDRVDKPFRILALDGGGIRGLYSATVLDSFSQSFAARRSAAFCLDVGKGFDLITGTSIGGIIACGLAFGLTTAELTRLLKSVGPQIFKTSIPDSTLAFASWALRHLHRSANSDEQLRSGLATQFGHATLESVFRDRRIALCVPSVNLSTCQSVVFKTPHEPHLTRDRHTELVDVCLSTSAAPIYLPLAAIRHPEDEAHDMLMVDGGLWANNPVLVGLIEGLGLAGRDQPIEILSISTCPMAQGTVASRRERNWGLFRWRAGTVAMRMSLESQSWGYYNMALKLAATLRKLGRKCNVIRLPHSAPSIEQSAYLGLDRASEDSIRVLTDLGRQDGDFDYVCSTLGSAEAEMVERIFEDMPPVLISHSKAATSRRRQARTPKSLVVAPSIRLVDESDLGAGFVTDISPPAPGTAFSYTNGQGEVAGTVRWSHSLSEGQSGFGIEKARV